MAKFFDVFPRTLYKIDGKRYGNFDTVTNVMFRIGMVRDTINNSAAYIRYTIKDGDTPESLADKFYDDPEAHWMILYANDIYNPYKDWPMDQRSFRNYIIDNYGSVEAAQTTYHHFEKVIRRETNNVVTETRFQVDEATINNTEIEAYESYQSLEDAYLAVNFGETSRTTTNSSIEGQTVIETISKDRISNYDYEQQVNEAKRLIKVVKKEYYSRIMSEFNNLTRNTNTPFLRRLV